MFKWHRLYLLKESFNFTGKNVPPNCFLEPHQVEFFLITPWLQGGSCKSFMFASVSPTTPATFGLWQASRHTWLSRARIQRMLTSFPWWGGNPPLGCGGDLIIFCFFVFGGEILSLFKNILYSVFLLQITPQFLVTLNCLVYNLLAKTSKAFGYFYGLAASCLNKCLFAQWKIDFFSLCLAIIVIPC